MNTYLSQLQINFKRLILRNITMLISNVALPILFYLIYTRVFVDSSLSGEYLDQWYVEYMISMMVFSATISSIFTISNIIFEDRKDQFQLFVHLSNKSLFFYFSSLLPILLVFQLSSFIGLGLVAFFVNQVSFSIFKWLALMVLSVLVSIPFIVIGNLTASIESQATLNIVNNIIVFPIAIIGGLWWPLEIMPDLVQTIAKFLPTYYAKTILEEVVFQGQLASKDILYISLMTGILIIILYASTRLSNRKELSV